MFSLDEAEPLAAAKRDPAGFIAQFNQPVIIDEVQRAPEIFLPIKVAVDKERHPGKFLLTGSANVLMLPKLAGRLEIATLWPLSQGELADVREDFASAVFAPEFNVRRYVPLPREELLNKMLLGGYPPILERTAASARARCSQPIAQRC